MKNAAACAKKLTSLLKKLPSVEPPEFEHADDPVAVLVLSFMMADATTEKALAGYRKLREHIVDFNDLRVSMPHEVAGYLGGRYPGAIDRCQRIRAALRNIYLREHAVTLDALREAGKRDARKYLESLEGMLPYVSARVLLMSFETHAIPVDTQLREQLVAGGAADEDADLAEISTWLTRQVRASDGLSTHLGLQAWVEANAGKGGRSRRKTSAKGGKSSTKKTSTRKKSTKVRSRTS